MHGWRVLSMARTSCRRRRTRLARARGGAVQTAYGTSPSRPAPRGDAARNPRPHFVYLSVHLSRPCWIGGSPLISMIGLSYVEDTFCLYVASLLVKPRPIE
jgi:hypothetical protein